MNTDLYDPDIDEDGLGPRGAGALNAPGDDGDTGGATVAGDPVEPVAASDPNPTDDGSPAIDDPEAPPAIEPIGLTDDAPAEASPPSIGAPAQVALEDIDVTQLLRDRPDVFQAFFTEFYGPNNDHHSSAWHDRVGGETPEAYGLYWYKTYGAREGYEPPVLARPAASLAEPEAPAVRTTADGIALDQILHDRPDVFQAFFTEFYGPNNDHHSSAWDNRVGGETPQDYANYWYEAYGKAEGYGARAQDPTSTVEEDDGARGEASPFGAPAGSEGLFLLT